MRAATGTDRLPTRPLIHSIGEWLIDQALSRPDVLDMFRQTCRKLDAAGVPVARARLTWQTLHPLFRAETVLWKRGGGEVEFEQFRHREQSSDEWNASPMKYMFDNEVDVLRRHLDGEHERLDFPILHDLKRDGLTDYLVVVTGLDGQTRMKYTVGPRPISWFGDRSDQDDGKGIIITWSSDREGGFTDDDVEALQNIQRRFAVAVKSAIQERIARNITQTYLGREAGDEVLAGLIKRGDGRRIRAVVWYCDMRGSTALADTMPADEFLALLNSYFDVTAGAVIAKGGEVLSFIGDAVLAIFPFDDEDSERLAVIAAREAMDEAFAAMNAVNAERAAAGAVALRFGVGLAVGEMTFGNIGTADRLAFSAIGSALNEVARIQDLTKALGCDVLATAEIAAREPGLWRSLGRHGLTGVAQPCELFAPAGMKVAGRAGVSVQAREGTQTRH